MYDLQILNMSCLVALYSDSIYKLLPQNVEDVEFDVHVRRGGGVANIRRGEIRIVLQLFLKVLLSFCLYVSALLSKLSKCCLYVSALFSKLSK